MRVRWIGATLAIFAGAALRAEIHDVLKNSEIEAALTKAHGASAILERPNYSIWLGSEAGARKPEAHDQDELLFIRHGSGSLWLGDHKYEIGPGDVAKVEQKTPRRLEAGQGRIEYIAVRISRGPAASGIRPSPHTMADVLRASEIAETFAKFESNQPIHTAANFTMNYVIYSGHPGPWESHRGCVDIYFIKMGTATGEYGGQIQHAREESPGEMRGDGVSGARRYAVGPGDIVVIPRETAHHMTPSGGKLGYLLVKVWAD